MIWSLKLRRKICEFSVSYLVAAVKGVTEVIHLATPFSSVHHSLPSLFLGLKPICLGWTLLTSFSITSFIVRIFFV